MDMAKRLGTVLLILGFGLSLLMAWAWEHSGNQVNAPEWLLFIFNASPAMLSLFAAYVLGTFRED